MANCGILPQAATKAKKQFPSFIKDTLLVIGCALSEKAIYIAVKDLLK